MKSGETALIAFRVKNIDIASVDAVIFTLKGASFITKNYPSDDVTYSDGRFVVALYQEDTIALGNGKRVLVEAQINSGDKSVIKSKYVVIDDKSTIATQILDGNTPTAYRLADIDLEFDSQFVVATIDEETVDEAVARAVNAAMQAESAVVAAQEATVGANNARDNANAAATEAVSIANNAASQAVTTANNAAQTAMNTATTAANNANSAAVEARQAKTEAIDAKTRTDEATAKANAATTSATNAAGLANTAAGTANTAASNADTARANAVTATSAANSAASAANTAASKANTAASNADTKASLANEKAELAAAKAGEADAAAIRANAAADTVDAKIRESLAGVNRELNAQNNRITNLEYASKGVLYREETDTQTAYSKSVPSGALPYGTLDYLGGRSVVVNQLIDYITNARTVSGVSVSFDEGIYTLNGSVGASASAWINIALKIRIESGHKYYVRTIGMQDKMYFYAKGIGTVISTSIVTSQSTEQNAIPYIVINNTSQEAYSVDANVNTAIIDLTQMFGSAADTMTVADVEAIIGTDYIPYNTGEIINAEVKSVESVGANMFDSETLTSKGFVAKDDYYYVSINSSATEYALWENTNNIKGAINIAFDTYYESASSQGLRMIVFYTDGTQDILYMTNAYNRWENRVHTTQSSKNVEKLGWTYGSNAVPTRIKNVFVGTESIEYVPYFHTENPLPTSLPTLLGINDEVKDRIEFEPVLYKNMKSVDLGSLNWSYMSAYKIFVSDVEAIDIATPKNMLTERYYLRGGNGQLQSLSTDENVMWIGSNVTGTSGIIVQASVVIKDDRYTNPQEFKKSVEGVILHYEAISGGEDYEAKLLHKKCDVYDLSVITDFTLDASGAFWYTTNSSFIKKLGIQNGNIACLGETYVKGIQVVNNGTIARFYSNDNTNAPTGLCLYEFYPEHILDVTDILKEWENSIHVEGGGTITFAQDGLHIPVPNAETYLVKVEV